MEKKAIDFGKIIDNGAIKEEAMKDGKLVIPEEQESTNDKNKATDEELKNK